MSSVINPFTGRWVMEPKIQNVWGNQHATWFTFMGIGGALFISRMLLGVELGRFWGMTWADILSLVLIGVGGLILIADLGKPFRLLRAFLNPRTSWISVGAISDFIFLGFAGLWTLADLDIPGVLNLTGLPWHGNSTLGLVFQVIAALAAVVVIVYPGLVLTSSPSIPFWNNAMIPMQFLVTAFSSAFGLALIYSAIATVDAATLTIWLAITAVLVIVSLFFQIGHLLNAQYSHVAGKFSVQRLVRGDLQLVYLGGVIVLGTIVPLALVAYGLSAGGSGALVTTAAAVAGVLLLVGNWLSKHAVIRAGAYAPLM